MVPERTALTRQVSAGDVSLSVSTSAGQIRTCDLLTLTVVVLYPDGVEIVLPREQTIATDFSVVDIREERPQLVRDNRVRVRQDWLLEPALPGVYSIKPLRVTAKGPDGGESVLSSAPLTIDVLSVLPPGDTVPDLRDIAPCARIGTGRAPLWTGLALVVILVCSVLVVARPGRRSPRPASVPRQAALDEIARLRQTGFQTSVPTKLQKIACKFLVDHYGVGPATATADALLDRLARTDAADVALPLLKVFFDRCARARFGRPAGPDQQARALLDRFEACLEVCCGKEDGHAL